MIRLRTIWGCSWCFQASCNRYLLVLPCDGIIPQMQLLKEMLYGKKILLLPHLDPLQSARRNNSESGNCATQYESQLEQPVKSARTIRRIFFFAFCITNLKTNLLLLFWQTMHTSFWCIWNSGRCLTHCAIAVKAGSTSAGPLRHSLPWCPRRENAILCQNNEEGGRKHLASVSARILQLSL